MASVLEKHGFEFIIIKPEDRAFAEQMHFSHAIIVPRSARTITESGQVGIQADATVPADMNTEFKVAFEKVKEVLVEAGLGANALEYVFEVTFLMPLERSGTERHKDLEACTRSVL